MTSERFVRQSALFSDGDMEKLRSATVAVVGCGGLGSQVIVNLVSAGVGGFILIDGDAVSESNLNRQFIHFGHVGVPKVVSAEQWILNADPCIRVKKHRCRLSEDSADILLKNADAVVDCLDNTESRAVLAQSCRRLGKTLVHAGVESEYGQVCVIRPESPVHLESILPKASGTHVSYSPAVSVIGATEADQTVKVLLGRSGALYDILLTYDGVSRTFSEHPLTRA